MADSRHSGPPREVTGRGSSASSLLSACINSSYVVFVVVAVSTVSTVWDNSLSAVGGATTVDFFSTCAGSSGCKEPFWIATASAAAPLTTSNTTFYRGIFLPYKVQGNFQTSPSTCPTSPLVTANAPCHPLVGGVAQWLERRSLTGELSLIYT